ncbi:hypothetical protein D3C74_18430 [compost metagenome]
MTKTARSNMSLSGSILPRTVDVKKRHFALHSSCASTRLDGLSNPAVPSLAPPVAVSRWDLVDLMDYVDLVDLVYLVDLIVLIILMLSS